MRLRFSPLSMAALSALLLAGSAQAATYTVTGSGGGPGSCSGTSCTTIRAAFAAAAGTPADDVIEFAANVSGDIVLLESLTLSGATGGALTLRGRLGSGGVPQINLSGDNLRRIASFSLGNTVLIQNLGLIDGLASGGVGGAIHNVATLTIENSVIAGNSAVSGGGIYSSGTLALRNSRVLDNTATNGAGLYTLGGTTLIEGSVISDNAASQQGGGLFTTSKVRVMQSELSDNTATHGGGIHADTTDAEAVVEYSTLSGNQATQHGGGIFTSNGVVEVRYSTLTAQHADGKGGGIHVSAGTLRLVQSTLSANTAASGGGIHSDSTFATLVLEYATLADNVADIGGGLFSTGDTTLDGSVIAGSSGSSDCHRADGEIAALNSFIGDDLTCVNGAAVGTLTGDPQLGALAYNGGATLTHLPHINSPLIDAAGACGDEHPIDQRGQSRPLGAACDIGAVERPGVSIFSDGFED